MSDQEQTSLFIDSAIPRSQYQVRDSNDIDDSSWDDFLAKTPGGHHVQTSLWAQIKAVNNWNVARVVATEQGKIVGGAQLLIRKIAPLASVVYLSKGPVTAVPNLHLVDVIIQHAIQIAQKNHALLFAIQPANNGYEIASCLPKWGFEPSQLELAPVASSLLDLGPSVDQLLANMKRQTRQNIRRSEQSVLTVRDGSEDDLDKFYEFHKATSNRQGFDPYAKEYYVQMWRIFKPRGYIQLFIAEYEGKPITGLLVIPFGDTVIAKILGWSGEHPDFRPNDAVFWYAIRWSKLNGYRYFDFEGMDRKGVETILAGGTLPAELQHSPDFFKLGYGGQVILYPPAYEMISNPVVHWIYKKVSPTVGGEAWGSRIMDKLRKR